MEQKAVGKSSLDAASVEPCVHREPLQFFDRERAFYGARSVVYAHVVAKQQARADLSEPEPCPAPDEIVDENQTFGGGDVPIALLRRLRSRGLSVEIDGCDVNPIAVEQATDRAKRQGVSATFFQHDVLDDALPDGYDIVMSSLFLHHLSGDEARGFLSNAAAAARRTVLIHDLVRCRAGLWLAQIGVRLLFCNDVCVHDGPRSVKGAFTIEEMRRLAVDAGLDACRIETRFPYRFLLQWNPDEASA